MSDPAAKLVLCSVGTRPEAIKMSPVVKALREMPWARCRVLATAQHRGLLDQTLQSVGISADVDLDMMTEGQTLPALTARLIVALDAALESEKPDFVLAQGDTTTVLCTALACFYRNIHFGHVEAGLRTGNLRSPFPEEANRAVASRLASLHLAPTELSRQNLLREGVNDASIRVTGNTVIDALYMAAERNTPIGVELDDSKRLVLVTAHRRESFGQPMLNICEAVNVLSRKYPDVEFLVPVHPNPSVKGVIGERVGSNPSVKLCEPMEYGRFVSAMKRAHILLTDSGGVQEEGPALRKPVLVMREVSERPEALRAGVARLVGTDVERIVSEVGRLLDSPAAYMQMASGASPFGDGRAAIRIVEAVGEYLGVRPEGSS
jgi:UDP-N-acetylglucosamine 2-epimerase (non-hydrolysing)